MSAADLALSRIEAILNEIEDLQRSLGFNVNQPSAQEAYALAARIERQMATWRSIGEVASGVASNLAKEPQ